MKADSDIHNASTWILFVNVGLVRGIDCVNGKRGNTFCMVVMLVLDAIRYSHPCITNRLHLRKQSEFNESIPNAAIHKRDTSP